CWNIRQLKRDLVAGPLPNREFIRYLFWLTFVTLLGIEGVPLLPPEGPVTGLDVITALLSIFFGMLGLIWAYRANGGDNGREFAARYFPICWVIAFRFVVFSVPLIIGIVVLPPTSEWIYVTILQLWIIAMYWRIAVHIGDIAREGAE
ncbi:hypothetical protein MRY87_03365, partial [bacterium]|nr:hypothetical protein [bacterium]